MFAIKNNSPAKAGARRAAAPAPPADESVLGTVKRAIDSVWNPKTKDAKMTIDLVKSVAMFLGAGSLMWAYGHELKI